MPILTPLDAYGYDLASKALNAHSHDVLKLFFWGIVCEVPEQS